MISRVARKAEVQIIFKPLMNFLPISRNILKEKHKLALNNII